MRVSELVGMHRRPARDHQVLPPRGPAHAGQATSATQARATASSTCADCGSSRALTESSDCRVQKARDVHRGSSSDARPSLFDTLGPAVAALPPYADAPGVADYPRAQAALEKLGQVYDPVRRGRPARARTRAAEAARDRRSTTAPRVRYGEHISAIAENDLATGCRPDVPARSSTAVLGTALYEPVIVGDAAASRTRTSPPADGDAGPEACAV